MIPEYKLYHGAVFSALVDLCGEVSIRSLHDTGRSHDYVISEVVGMQIKHATQRLHPWHFTFTEAHLASLNFLKAWSEKAFVILVCHTDGMVCIPLDEVMPALSSAEGAQAWLRADRRKGEWYRVYGPQGEMPQRYPAGVERIAEHIRQATRS